MARRKPTNDDFDQNNDFFNNPANRIPVALLLDNSGSMGSGATPAPIDQLNDGVSQFFADIQSDKMASKSVEVSVISFSNEVKQIVPFGSVSVQNVPKMSANGSTHMGTAIHLGLDKLTERKEQYKSSGVGYYQPIMVIMTDGEPYGESIDIINSATKRIQALVVERKLTIIAVAIGNNVDMETLSKVSPLDPPIRLGEISFTAFFKWLSDSMSKIPNSDKSIDSYSKIIDRSNLKAAFSR